MIKIHLAYWILQTKDALLEIENIIILPTLLGENRQNNYNEIITSRPDDWWYDVSLVVEKKKKKK